MTIKAKNKKGITKIKTNRTKILKVLKARKMIKMKIKQNNKIMIKFLKVQVRLMDGQSILLKIKTFKKKNKRSLMIKFKKNRKFKLEDKERM